MTPEIVLDLYGEALYLVVVLVAVIVLPSLLVGLVIATFQAATQINEQTLSFLPRLLVTLLTIMWAGPWILTKLLDHFGNIFTNIPLFLG